MKWRNRQLTETVMIGGYVAIVIFTQSPYGLIIKDPQVSCGMLKSVVSNNRH